MMFYSGKELVISLDDLKRRATMPVLRAWKNIFI